MSKTDNLRARAEQATRGYYVALTEEEGAAILALLDERDDLAGDEALIRAERRDALAAERRATVERIDWQAVRSAISNAYYETREAGGTMEAAADRAVAHVRAILDEEAAR